MGTVSVLARCGDMYYSDHAMVTCITQTMQICNDESSSTNLLKLYEGNATPFNFLLVKNSVK